MEMSTHILWSGFRMLPRPAIVSLALCCVCTSSAQESARATTEAQPAIQLTPVTMAELTHVTTGRVTVHEVTDYVYGGFQGDLPCPPHADLNPRKAFIICWRDFPYRFVFSHEASYCPWFELPSGGAVSFQFFEGNLGWAELFNNFGRQEQNSSIKILEAGPERVNVRWTYYGVNMESGQRAYRGIEDFWAYSNGLIVRRQTFETLLPDNPRGYAREPIELIGLSPAGKCWRDVLQPGPNSDERHALAVLDAFSGKRYDVFWKPLPETVWDSTHRRSGCAWRDLDNAPGVVIAIPMVDGAPFCAFGDSSGFPHETTRIKDLTFTAEAWGSISWDHWPIGWLNSQAHIIDTESLHRYPNHFSPLGMDLFALTDKQVEGREYYSLLGVSGGDWEATRRCVRNWLENDPAGAITADAADLPAIWSPSANVVSSSPPDTSQLTGVAPHPTLQSAPSQEPHFPLDMGVQVNGFQDDFDDLVRNPVWVAVPADRDCYQQADGVLRVTTTDTNPSHLLFKGTDYDAAVQEVLARIRVKALAAGANPVAGITVAANPDAAHAGEGINFIFINDPGDCLGAAGPVLRLVDDWRAWGPAVPDIYWKTDVWYWLRLGQTGPSPGADTNIHAKIWRADGSEPEPAEWQIAWARDGRSGLAGLRAPHDGSPAEFEVDYILLKANGLPLITVTAGASRSLSRSK